MTHCFKLFDLTVSDMRRTRTVLAYYIKHWGVKATFLRRVAYIHLADDQAFSLVLNHLDQLSRQGKMTATKKNLDWFKNLRP